jgi:hypothetical protein
MPELLIRNVYPESKFFPESPIDKIPDPGSGFFSIPDPGVKEAPDPGSATLSNALNIF